MAARAVALVATLLLVVVGIPTLAAADSAATAPQGAASVGEISGTVTGPEGGPLPGADVTLQGESLIQAMARTFSSANGLFRFRNLRPGTYTVTVSLSGFQSLEYQVAVNVGAIATVLVSLELAGAEEVLTVTAQSPLIEIAKAQISSSYGEDLIASIPIAREFVEVQDFTPGITDRGAYGAGGVVESRYRRGSSTSAYKLNGVDITEPDWGTTWVNPSIDTIAEIQVVGIGASAEYGNFTGATVNIVTKGGTNEFHGALSHYYSADALRGDNAGGVPEYTRGFFDYDHDFSVSLGGPLVREKLLFFSNYGYSTIKRQPFADPSFEGVDPRRETTTRNRFHGRLDWLLNDSNVVGFMFNADPSTDRGLGQGPGDGPEIGNDIDFSTKSWLVSWQSQLSDNAYFDFRYGGYLGNYLEEPIVCCDVPLIFDYLTNISYNTSGFILDEDNGRHEVNTSLTYYADEFLGASHNLKIGMEYENTWSLFLGRYTGDDAGAIFIYPYYGYTYIYGFTYDSHLDVEIKRVSAFVQDDIQIGDRLNLNLGLRWDNVKLDDLYGPGSRATEDPRYDGSLDPAIYPPAVYGPAPRQLTHLSNLAPRLGATLDLAGDARYVAHGSWGRYFEKAMAYGPISSHGAAYESFEYFFNYTDVPWDPNNIDTEFWTSLAFAPEAFVLSYAYGENVPYALDPDLKQQHTDVVNVGLEVELAPDWIVGADYIHKRDRDMMIPVDRAPHTYVPFEYTDPLGGTQTLYEQTDDLASDFIISNDDYYFRTHDMFIVSLEKRASRDFSFNTSLTWQKSFGNIENTVDANWGFGNLYSASTNPNFNGHPYSEGLLTHNREWQFKTFANYRLPWGIQAAVYYRLESGRLWTPRIRKRRIPQLDNTAAGTWGNVRLEPRGNRPTDALNNLDLRFGKVFDIGNTSLDFTVDVFNAINSNSVRGDRNDAGMYRNINSTFPISGGNSFGEPRRIVRPRQVRLAIRFVF
ncbi:MAG: TonB-dependent receptor [Acidobacteria bacterium]|nr:TonB-dependent receptor [Acidobacteriota bacterium]